MLKDSGERRECLKCGNEDIYCKGMCRSCYEKSLRARNPEFVQRQRDNANKWRKEHPEWVNNARKKRIEDPYCRKRDKATKKRGALRSVGLTEYTSHLLLQKQNNKCAICGRNLDEVGAKHLDHNHDTGKARGYLCSRCNNGIGMLEESTEMLQKAITYLNNPPANEFVEGGETDERQCKSS